MLIYLLELSYKREPTYSDPLLCPVSFSPSLPLTLTILFSLPTYIYYYDVESECLARYFQCISVIL